MAFNPYASPRGSRALTFGTLAPTSSNPLSRHKSPTLSGPAISFLSMLIAESAAGLRPRRRHAPRGQRSLPFAASQRGASPDYDASGMRVSPNVRSTIGVRGLLRFPARGHCSLGPANIS
jgi:hypothetical protein